MLAAAYQMLFNVPLKDVGLSDVYVTASVYPLSELADEANRLTLENNEQNEVTISYGEDDGSKQMSITIPDMPASRITMTSDVMEKCEYATAVTWSSKYFLKEIRYDDKNDENGGTIYVSAFKTTLLGNKAKDYNSKMLNLEMRRIDKIVFVAKDGKETVLWENAVE